MPEPIHADDVAKKILETVPPVMEQLRLEMRSGAPQDMTTPQFRILGCIYRKMDRVGAIARHIGISQPAASKMVEMLVRRGWVERATHAEDRRQVPLKLTRKGQTLYLQARDKARSSLSSKIKRMKRGDRDLLMAGLLQLQNLFALEDSARVSSARKTQS